MEKGQIGCAGRRRGRRNVRESWHARVLRGQVCLCTDRGGSGPRRLRACRGWLVARLRRWGGQLGGWLVRCAVLLEMPSWWRRSSWRLLEEGRQGRIEHPSRAEKYRSRPPFARQTQLRGKWHSPRLLKMTRCRPYLLAPVSTWRPQGVLILSLRTHIWS